MTTDEVKSMAALRGAAWSGGPRGWQAWPALRWAGMGPAAGDDKFGISCEG